jgi:hypothetical protein
MSPAWAVAATKTAMEIASVRAAATVVTSGPPTYRPDCGLGRNRGLARYRYRTKTSSAIESKIAAITAASWERPIAKNSSGPTMGASTARNKSHPFPRG